MMRDTIYGKFQYIKVNLNTPFGRLRAHALFADCLRHEHTTALGNEHLFTGRETRDMSDISCKFKLYTD